MCMFDVIQGRRTNFRQSSQAIGASLTKNFFNPNPKRVGVILLAQNGNSFVLLSGYDSTGIPFGVITAQEASKIFRVEEYGTLVTGPISVTNLAAGTSGCQVVEIWTDQEYEEQPGSWKTTR